MKKNGHHFLQSTSSNWGDLQEAKKDFAEKLIHAPARRAGERTQGAFVSATRALTTAIDPTPESNVIGVGIGEKISEGRQTGVPAVKFLVHLKYPKADLKSAHVLPTHVDGIPTDVEEVGTFRRFAGAGTARARKQAAAAMPNPRTKIRPAQPGSSIGFRDPNNQFVMAGTFGALVKDKAGLYVLSNNHVLADENKFPQPGPGVPAVPIFQPGLLDSGNPATDQIAELARYITLMAQTPNAVDCALAKANSVSIVSNEILFIGAPQGTASAAIDMTVHKFGRTTGYTVGQVTSIDTDVKVQYDLGTLTFTEQIIVVGNSGQDFSNAGDSGSLILERATNKAVGLLFAGSSSHTIANHIDQVLKALGVSLA